MKAKTNVLIALANILDRDSTRLTPIFRSNGSANAAGDSLEYFVKDMFCTGAEKYQYDHEKDKEYKKYLSWSGDSKHFPDLIVDGGVGVEPKKVNNTSKGKIALNSSFPKDYIYPDTQNIPTKDNGYLECGWTRKPIIYAVGNLNTKKGEDENKLISLWLVYGNTFVADNDSYKTLVSEVRNAISKNTNADLDGKSKELARAHGIDPLKYTNLRVRGMYELEHPAKVFESYISDIDFPENKSHIYVVILKSDFDAIKHDMGNEWESLNDKLNNYVKERRLIIKSIEVADPNNLEANLDAVILAGYTN